MAACPSCGEDNPGKARFCWSCGAPQALAAPETREVRKTVTVVFSDVTGSTSLGERLDPESLRRVMSRYFDRMRSVLERHGGTVEKFIGDAVMAVFGIPTLHEDDALRAVRAADDMRAELSLLNAELERAFQVTIAARTGMNTGEVVAGDPSGGQALVTGDPVNTAARLEQAASPGEILIGDATLRLVRDAVKVEPVEPVVAKGKAEPVPAFRLLEVLPAAAGFARRLDSPLVGRDREIELLRQALERCASDRACHLFTILGPAGVGKSRLAEEFLQEVSVRATVLRGRCLPYGEGITFWPVSEMVRHAAGIGDETDPEDARSRIAALVAGEEHGDVVAERIGQVLGLVADSAVPEETFWAIRSLLEAISRRGPLVVVFDDVHWAEPTLLDLVEHVAEWSRDASILVLCLARSELLDHRPAWGGGKLNATSILLEALSGDETTRLIGNLLGTVDLAPGIRARIVEAAEGNPLFVEEMLAMLIDQGVVRREGERWVGETSRISVPPTIQALIASRLDRLGQPERAAIERASVIGKVFYRSAVEELTVEARREAVRGSLMALVRKDLVRPDRSSFAGQEVFRFRHILIRDAAYESMPKELRADLHERFADWLERSARGRVIEYEEILGYHLEQAYRYRAELGAGLARARGDVGNRAAGRLANAGRRAHARGDVAGAAGLFGRAASLLAPEDPTRPLVLANQGTALFERGDFGAAEEAFEEAVSAAAAGDPAVEAHVLIEQGLFHFVSETKGGIQRAVKLVERLLPVLEGSGDELGLAKACRLLAMGHLWHAEYTPMQRALEKGLPHARRAGDRREEAEIVFWLGLTLSGGPTRVKDAIERQERLLAEAGDSVLMQSGALVSLGLLWSMDGRIDRAREFLGRGRAIARELGLWLRLGGTGNASGSSELIGGDAAAAERVLREGGEILRGIGEEAYLSSNVARLAEAVYQQGRYDEAERFARESEELAASDDLDPQVLWRSVRAKVLARRGQVEPAEILAREAVDMAHGTDDLQLQGGALMDLAEVLRAAGRTGEATGAVRRALEAFDRKGVVPLAARARAVLSELEGPS